MPDVVTHSFIFEGSMSLAVVAILFYHRAWETEWHIQRIFQVLSMFILGAIVLYQLNFPLIIGIHLLAKTYPFLHTVLVAWGALKWSADVLDFQFNGNVAVSLGGNIPPLCIKSSKHVKIKE